MGAFKLCQVPTGCLPDITCIRSLEALVAEALVMSALPPAHRLWRVRRPLLEWMMRSVWS